MKVVVTSQGPGRESEVDPRFGRARYFVLVDTGTGEESVHDNVQNLEAAQGAGIQAARTVTDLGAEALISGNLGPRAFSALQAAGVALYVGATGTVAEALEQFEAGKLQRADGPNVQSHWV
jgi:predicted Fe-Mo cluster-binding NifX family protein